MMTDVHLFFVLALLLIGTFVSIALGTGFEDEDLVPIIQTESPTFRIVTR